MVILLKYIRETEWCIFQVQKEIHRGKVLKIDHINDDFNLFPYYDFGDNYRENDQNDSLQSSY